MAVIDKYPSADWGRIQEVWCTGVGSLGETANEYGVPLPAVLLAAKEQEWDGRESPWEGVVPKEPLVPEDVKKQHKVQVGMIRELTELFLKQLEFADGVSGRVKILDKLSAISVRNINLERTIYSLDMDSDGSPDAVEIHTK